MVGVWLPVSLQRYKKYNFLLDLAVCNTFTIFKKYNVFSNLNLGINILKIKAYIHWENPTMITKQVNKVKLFYNVWEYFHGLLDN